MKLLKPKLTTSPGRRVAPAPKQTDPYYLTPEHQAWRNEVLRRANYQCEALDERTGRRCTASRPHHRLFADHIHERKDGGDPLDPANGQCLCGHHDRLKTAAVRTQRQSQGVKFPTP